MVQQVKKRATLKTQIYDFLKEQIITGILKPGERLIEEKISLELEVSRSPIREAIRMLEKDGMIYVNRSGGVTVVEPTVEDYQHLYECRVELEPVAAFYAAHRRTAEQLEVIRLSLLQMEDYSKEEDFYKNQEKNANFHESIVEASNNPFLSSMISQIQGINSFYRRAILNEDPMHLEEAKNEHKQILQAIVDQNAEKAKKLMAKHIESDYKLFLKLILKE